MEPYALEVKYNFAVPFMTLLKPTKKDNDWSTQSRMIRSVWSTVAPHPRISAMPKSYTGIEVYHIGLYRMV